MSAGGDRSFRGSPRVAWRRAWWVPSHLAGALLRVLYGLRAEGSRRLPPRGPLVYVANHQSHLDAVAVGALVWRRPCAFLARASLFDVQPLGWIIRLFGAIPLEREKSSPAALRTAIGELRAGRCVLVFPEGTRTGDGSIGPFRRGAMLLVKKTGAAVVPIALAGFHEVWPSDRRWPRLRGRVAVSIGAPLPARELLALDEGDALARIRDRVVQMHAALKKSLPPE